MKKKEIEFWIKTFPEKQRQARETDLPRRLAILTPEAAINWINVIDKALPLVALETSERPCDYGPWRKALRSLTAPAQPESTYTLRFADADSGLINFSVDASMPGWPDEHAHLVEFALRYLEADVMLFRSGYTKRHLLRRLRQAKLDQSQKARCVALIKRAVTQGTGLEEFREFKRLAGRVADEKAIAWLEDKAAGAMVTAEDFGPDYLEVLHRLSKMDNWKHNRWFVSPVDAKELDNASLEVLAKGLPQDNRIKLNAWRILRHVFVVRG